MSSSSLLIKSHIAYECNLNCHKIKLIGFLLYEASLGD
jgi:hypothetical protein